MHKLSAKNNEKGIPGDQLSEEKQKIKAGTAVTENQIYIIHKGANMHAVRTPWYGTSSNSSLVPNDNIRHSCTKLNFIADAHLRIGAAPASSLLSQ